MRVGGYNPNLLHRKRQGTTRGVAGGGGCRGCDRATTIEENLSEEDMCTTTLAELDYEVLYISEYGTIALFR